MRSAVSRDPSDWRFRLASLAVMALGLPFPAAAALGKDIRSVQSDRAHMQAELKITPAAGYTVHELQVPTGTLVREYVSPEGRVFAVSWQGPFIPDLRQLLGAHFEPFARAAQESKARRVGRGPLLVEQPGLVVYSGGHMRAFAGRAYVPEMVPPGVTLEALE